MAKFDWTIFKPLRKIADDYGPELLCGGACLLIGTELFLALRASDKVVEVTKEYKEKIEKIDESSDTMTEEEIKHEKNEARIVRDLHYVYAYKFAAGCGLLAMIMLWIANRVQGSKIVGLTAALYAGEDKIKKAFNKVKEKVGDEKFNEIKKELIQDAADERVKKAKEDGDMPPWDEDLPEGVSRYWDPITEQLLIIPEKQVEDAIITVKDRIGRNHKVEFNEWRGYLGLSNLKIAKGWEWNSLAPFDVEIGDFILDDQVVKLIGYVNDPTLKKI